MYVGVDDGERLAAPGIVWQVYDRSWEVLFTGSLAWKHVASRVKRSHKIVLSGPHFIFVRPADLIGKPICWGDIYKFHVQNFFTHGDPAPVVNKATLAEEFDRTQAFLSEVENPKIWSDIRLVTNPARRRRKNKILSGDEDALPLKRSRRLMELERKTSINRKQEEERTRKAEEMK